MAEAAAGPAGRAVGAVWLAVMLVLADLTTKWVATQLDGDVPLVEVHHNRDLALGVASLGDARSLPLAALAAVAVAQMVGRHWRGQAPAWLLPALMAGAVANALDRAVDGAVTDWFALGPLVLNVADVALFAALAAHGWGVLTDRTPAPVGAAPDDEGR
jgi:lipoprotein signal peptidase